MGTKSTLIDLSGQRFGRLTILMRAADNKWGHVCWKCRCDCGNEIEMSGNRLKRGNTKSCGCLNRELSAIRSRKKYNVTNNQDGSVSIPLGRGRFSVIDSEDVPKVSSHGWYLSKHGYACSRISGRLMKLHQIIVDVPVGKEVDHIDRSKLNNRKSNLRVVDHANNTRNSELRRHSSTGYVGVSFSKKAKKYCSYVDFNGKRISLGLFPSALEAALERDKKAAELCPCYRLNFEKQNG